MGLRDERTQPTNQPTNKSNSRSLKEGRMEDEMTWWWESGWERQLLKSSRCEPLSDWAKVGDSVTERQNTVVLRRCVSRARVTFYLLGS